MKRQFYFDHVERELLICALEFFSVQIAGGVASKAHQKCGEFTQARIAEMLVKLNAPDTPKAVA